MMIAAATLERSVGAVAANFAAICIAAASEATASLHVVSGLRDGNDYGRYAAGENPLVPYAPATSIAGMIAQGAVLRAAVATAAARAVLSASDVQTYPGAITALCDALRASCADPADAILIFTELARFDGRPMVLGADALARQMRSLCILAAMLIRRAAAASLASATADYHPTSYQDAVALRNQVTDSIDLVAVEAGDNLDEASYDALETLRGAIAADYAIRGADLAPVVTRTFGANLPAVVLAYRLYDNADRAFEVIARNNPIHPGWMPTSIEGLAA